ncbi:hypothetical protein CSUI_010942 [Cystoisospora suis]|uniref:Uncharacterized protein n=1 Tax=Cystoisospora suis TaxID=483139 RepID=A0A2C6KFY6_9APIC|nr:hypothetical protein CSUI_010942 [Cystoisospora suis]
MLKCTMHTTTCPSGVCTPQSSSDSPVPVPFFRPSSVLPSLGFPLFSWSFLSRLSTTQYPPTAFCASLGKAKDSPLHTHRDEKKTNHPSTHRRLLFLWGEEG